MFEKNTRNFFQVSWRLGLDVRKASLLYTPGASSWEEWDRQGASATTMYPGSMAKRETQELSPTRATYHQE